MATNMGASVQARLKNLSRDRGIDMVALLRRYAQERLLYRLSVSEEASNFCVKGGLLLSAYNDGDLLRPTEDIDFNGFDPDADVAAVEAALRRVLATEVPDDGVSFFAETIRVQKDRTGRIPGGKVSFAAKVHTSRVEVRVDVGFGNPVSPGVRKLVMPTLLEGVAPRPEVLAYPLETVVSEKLHAMAQFGVLNTRVKDYFDLWMLSRTQSFEGAELVSAIVRTFEAQGRAVPPAPFEGLTPDYAAEQERAWGAFLSRIDHRSPLGLGDVVADLADFAHPLTESARTQEPFEASWQPGEGWRRPSLSMSA